MDLPVRVFLIHRYRLLTDALRSSLASDAEIELVGHTGYVNEAIRRLAELAVDVVLIEADLDEAPSRPVIRQLRSAHPELKVVPIGLESNAQVLECIEAGAAGYLPLEASLAELVATLRLIREGKAPPCSPELAVAIFDRLAELSRHDEARSRRHPQSVYLTPREKQVLECVAAGLRNKEIARELEVAVPTVKNHVHKILEKLSARRRREAVRIAYEIGILEDPVLPP
ncbi:MAG TPA: response regulator transcription factor [Thermoanaerobaculia bacterium]|jgi:DNA-binding NarL/FixJ family response regulator